MAIGDYLRAFRRFWWLIVVVAVIGAAGGYVWSLVAPAKYASTAQLFVTTQSGTSVGDAYQNNLFSQERVKSYAGLATSRQVAARAVEQLKSSMSADDLRAKITAAPVLNTVLLDVTASDSDPVAAQTYANAVADQLVQLVSELETSRRGGTPAAGAILVDDADYPSSASGPSLVTRIGLGAVAGLALGVIAVIVLALVDTRVRRRERVEEIAGSLVLGEIPADAHRPGVAVVDPAAGGELVERTRQLATNLRFARSADGTRPVVIAVTSPAHGDGRSTLAVDLAAVLAESGRRVLLVDGDLVSPTLADRLIVGGPGGRSQPVSGLSTVLLGDDTLDDAVINRVGGRSFSLLPAGPVPASRGQLWGGDRAQQVFADLSVRYDHVVVDTPPLADNTDGAVAAALGDGALVLARLGHTRSTALRRGLESIATAHAQFLGAVVTGAGQTRGGSGDDRGAADDQSQHRSDPGSASNQDGDDHRGAHHRRANDPDDDPMTEGR
ncbi:polysaccharide biosynthesis tyrosine autokinase [Williamsia deligens]|uniref:Wzz/FepE/Etk N-terminal domain-containing protein n=1 Tax=Williamsia deligens TaxID=321325 RepID=A0ABW3G931_9NOCA|nr:polysaccharide biosynthesis tyrosine autokinase [Williamsia deligens]MCP2195743.1 receptor protein-tyrosine kinase [Williamsia deligens]